jgi:hypothetical protein
MTVLLTPSADTQSEAILVRISFLLSALRIALAAQLYECARLAQQSAYDMWQAAQQFKLKPMRVTPAPPWRNRLCSRLVRRSKTFLLKTAYKKGLKAFMP